MVEHLKQEGTSHGSNDLTRRHQGSQGSERGLQGRVGGAGGQ